MSSLGSKIFAKLVSLRGDKKMFADKATFEKLCEDSKNQHSQPFEMNFSKFTSSVEKQEADGMLYYILKPKEVFSNNKVMYFHGGAYILEITPEHWKMIDNIASQSGIEMWAGNRETCDPVISPVYGDLDIPCKIYVFTGTNDIINADAKEFLKATKKIGKTIEYNEVEGLQHDFVMWPIPEARNAVKKICSVLR